MPVIADQSLMPRYRMFCWRCLTPAPCHKIWFKTSKVICPECYSAMTEEQVRRFHDNHPDSMASITKIPEIREKSYLYVPQPIKPLPPLTSSWEPLSTYQITHSSERTLRAAVKSGALSKARFRIEMRRRKDIDYYQSLAEVPEIPMEKSI